jgi:hypothetical protein
VLPLHHGVMRLSISDCRFSIESATERHSILKSQIAIRNSQFNSAARRAPPVGSFDVFSPGEQKRCLHLLCSPGFEPGSFRVLPIRRRAISLCANAPNFHKSAHSVKPKNSTLRSDALAKLRLLRRRRETDIDGRAAALHALHRNFSVMRRHDRFRDRHPEPGAVRFSMRDERFEKSRQK